MLTSYHKMKTKQSKEERVRERERLESVHLKNSKSSAYSFVKCRCCRYLHIEGLPSSVQTTKMRERCRNEQILLARSHSTRERAKEESLFVRAIKDKSLSEYAIERRVFSAEEKQQLTNERTNEYRLAKVFLLLAG